jgi:hypothetical protein
MSDSISEYYAALARLKQRKAKINNDTVALEAGRKKGSIKKSRPQFAELILAIEDAQKTVVRPEAAVADRLEQARGNAKGLQQRLDASLVRELALVREVFHLRKELAALRGGKVVPIHSATQSTAVER